MSGSSIELESRDVTTATEREGRNVSTLPTAASDKDEGKPAGPQSLAHTESGPLARTSQHDGSDLQHPIGSSNPRSINELGGEQSHQGTEGPYPSSSVHIDRDLERGGPSTPPSLVPPVIADPDQEARDSGPIEATRSTMTEQSHNLERYLVSVLNKKKYQEYAMGCGTAVHNGFLVDKIFGNVARWSSDTQTWWPLALVATTLQHMIARWVHSGYRKQSETFHPHLHDGTAVHLIQNIGSPADLWMSRTLEKKLGLEPSFLLEHLALVCDGELFPVDWRVWGSRPLRCTSSWHVRAVLSDPQMLQFVPWSEVPPLEKATVATISFQQTRQGSFLVLLNMKTNVTLGERLEGFLRAQDTFSTASARRAVFLARTREEHPTAFRTIHQLLKLSGFLTVMRLVWDFLAAMRNLWVFVIRLPFFLLEIQYGEVDCYGEVVVGWPKLRRKLWRRIPRLPQSPFFEFLEKWLTDPVNIKMLTHMTSNLAHDSNASKAAENRCVWLLNRANWRHEVRHLSTESELLEHQAVERSNFNTLKRLVQCRRTTKRVKDGIETFRSYTPATPADCTPVMQSWADQQQARSDQQRRQRQRRRRGREEFPNYQKSKFFPTLQVERNPIELHYWQRRAEKTWEPEESAGLTVEHVEDTLSRSLSLLQDAIAVQTSDRALWLALIATFYFPATLATGIFGMNLSLIDGKPWWWAIAVCGILFVPNLAFLIYVFGRR